MHLNSVKLEKMDLALQVHDVAAEASVWNRLKSGAILDLFKDENEDEKVYNAQMIKFAFSKIQKDCPVPEEYIARLDEIE